MVRTLWWFFRYRRCRCPICRHALRFPPAISGKAENSRPVTHTKSRSSRYRCTCPLYAPPNKDFASKFSPLSAKYCVLKFCPHPGSLITCSITCNLRLTSPCAVVCALLKLILQERRPFAMPGCRKGAFYYGSSKQNQRAKGRTHYGTVLPSGVPLLALPVVSMCALGIINCL